MRDLLTKAIVNLLDNERFYAEIILRMNIIISKRIPTAGVCIKDTIQLHINPDYFASLSTKEQVAILKHECHHILFDHIPRGKELAPDVYDKSKSSEDKVINQMKHMSINIAADCAINPMVPDIPKEGMFPKTFDLPDGETMEWYMAKLKDNEKAKDFMQYDDHALWSESEGDKEILREKIRQHINEAAKKSGGNLSMEQQLLIDRLNYKAKDWRSDIRMFVANQIETVLESSKKKRNRRYGTMYPGTIKWEKLTLGVAIDTSGSISDEALCQFMAEIANVTKYAKVIVVEADAEIKNRYEFDPKKKYTVSGRGGTAYQPALDHFTKKEKVDGVIYFGDMDCFDNEEIKKPKYPVLWAIVGDSEPPVDWGRKTKVEVKNGY